VSLTSPIPDEQGIAHTAAGAECFLCGRVLRDPAVFWMGATTDIYLHPHCVTEFAIALFRDLSELKQLRRREARQGASL
jgi:hypothetical protein